MTQQQYLESLGRYGDIHEIVGASSLIAEMRQSLRQELQAWFSARGFPSHSSDDGRFVQVFNMPHDNWPELDLEWCDDDTLLVCDLGPSRRPAFPLLAELLEKRGLTLRLLQARFGP